MTSIDLAEDRTTPSRHPIRLTQFGADGGCDCKLPPGQLESLLGTLGPMPAFPGPHRLLVGIDGGDDAAAVVLDGDRALLATADFFTPVVDDPYDWGRIAAANALSDIYAMGGEPLLAINLLGWPRTALPMELAAEVLRGGQATAALATCAVAGGHSVDDAEPKYGMAVTGVAQQDELLRNNAARAGLPLTLTKPLGIGMLVKRSKQTGEVFAHLVETMTTLNRDASHTARARKIRAATDVTGFGLLGHLWKLVRASGVSAVLDVGAIPLLEGARDAAVRGHVPCSTERTLEWVRPHLSTTVSELDLLLLADPQTSGGLLVVGEVPGYPIIGEVIPQEAPGISTITLR